jgi:NTP pyrophosphatase (non-canonical NTP hydrolase)
VCLAGEVGETCNEIKKWSRGDFNVQELTKRLEEELPDILIYLVMLSHAVGVDLEKAYAEKKEYNDERFGTKQN